MLFVIMLLCYWYVCSSSMTAAAALALIDQPGIDAEEVVRKAMKIAGDICVYTNHNVLLEKIDSNAPAAVVQPAAADTTTGTTGADSSSTSTTTSTTSVSASI